MKTNYKKNLGSVSCGTMRTEDLIDSFIYELQSQRPLRREDRKLIREIRRNEKNMVDPTYYENEQSQWDLDALFDALNNYCLPYFSFGAHPGDGADYGYWLSEDFQSEFDGLQVSDLSEVPTNYTGEVLHVNDHGNMSLYVYNRGRSRELWAIV